MSPRVKSEISNTDIWQSTSNTAGSTHSHMTNLHKRLWRRANLSKSGKSQLLTTKKVHSSINSIIPTNILDFQGNPGPPGDTYGSGVNLSLKSKGRASSKQKKLSLGETESLEQPGS